MVFSKVPAKPDQDVEYAPVRHEGRRVPGRRRREPASRTGRPYPGTRRGQATGEAGYGVF